jgi:hypothetical protein
MQHADEAQITAYLDRQLEYADPENRRELGRHIADCGQCSKLLKELRRIRSEAEELLESTTPAAVAIPPFQEVVKRAQAIRAGDDDMDDDDESKTTVGVAPPVSRTDADEVDEESEDDDIDGEDQFDASPVTAVEEVVEEVEDEPTSRPVSQRVEDESDDEIGVPERSEARWSEEDDDGDLDSDDAAPVVWADAGDDAPAANAAAGVAEDVARDTGMDRVPTMDFAAEFGMSAEANDDEDESEEPVPSATAGMSEPLSAHADTGEANEDAETPEPTTMLHDDDDVDVEADDVYEEPEPVQHSPPGLGIEHPAADMLSADAAEPASPPSLQLDRSFELPEPEPAKPAGDFEIVRGVDAHDLDAFAPSPDIISRSHHDPDAVPPPSPTPRPPSSAGLDITPSGSPESFEVPELDMRGADEMLAADSKPASGDRAEADTRSSGQFFAALGPEFGGEEPASEAAKGSAADDGAWSEWADDWKEPAEPLAKKATSGAPGGRGGRSGAKVVPLTKSRGASTGLGPTGTRWLAIAATVVLAASAGIFGQKLGLYRLPFGGGDEAAGAANEVLAANEAATQPETGLRADDASGLASAAGRATEEARRNQPTTRTPSPQSRAAEAPARAVAAADEAANLAMADSLAQGVAGEPPPAAVLARDAAGDNRERALGQAASPAAAPPAQAPAEAAKREDDEAMGEWTVVSRRAAERILGGDLVAVPTLPIVEIAASNTEDAVRVRQTLDRGGELELTLRRSEEGQMGTELNPRVLSMETDASGASLASGRVGPYSVTARAAVFQAQLGELVRSLAKAPDAN